MKTRFLAVITAFLMISVIFSTVVFEEDASYESPILLGDDTTVTATPAVPVLDGLDLSNVQESKSGPGYDWKPSGDEQSYTLTLSGVVIQSHEYYGLNLPDADVTIELKEGTQNYIRGGDVVSGSSYGILASSSNLTIAGSGSLTVIGGTASQSSYGIYGIGIVEISDNAQVTAISGTAIEYSHGIHTDSNMNISDAQVTAIGGTASRGSGIFAVGNISLKGGLLITSSESDNGQALSIHNFEDLTGLDLLDPEGNKSYESKFAVYGDGSTYGVLTQTLNLLQLQSCGDLEKDHYEWDSNTSTLTLKNLILVPMNNHSSLHLPDGSKIILEGLNIIHGNDGNSYYSRGIFAQGNLTIQGAHNNLGSLYILGKNASFHNYGVYAGGDIEISNNAQVTAVCTNIDGDSHGISARGIAIKNNAQVITIGGTASQSSYGINILGGSINLSDNAQVITIGGTASLSSYGIAAASIELLGSANIIAIGGTTDSNYSDSRGINLTDSNNNASINLSDNAQVTAIGGTASQSSYGIATDNVTINGGTILAKCGIISKLSTIDFKSNFTDNTLGLNVSDSVIISPSKKSISAFITTAIDGELTMIDNYLPENIYDISGEISNNKIFYATISYPVTYETNGGQGDLPNEKQYLVGITVTIAESILSKADHTFTGWCNPETKVTYQPGNTFTMPAKSVTLEAVWKSNPSPPSPIPSPTPTPTYKVSYDANGGEGNVPSNRWYAANSNVTVAENTLSKEGYLFLGWCNSETKVTYQPGETFKMPSKSVTLQALWTPEAYVTVTFCVDNKVWKEVTLVKNTSLNEKMPADPEKQYCDFTGWCTADNKEFTSSTKVTADITVYAGWQASAGYVEVTYIINDEVHLTEIYETGKISEPEISMPQGKELRGWYTDKELQNKFDFNSEVTNNLTLYAKWENTSSYLPYLLAALIVIVIVAAVIWYLKK